MLQTIDFAQFKTLKLISIDLCCHQQEILGMQSKWAIHTLRMYRQYCRVILFQTQFYFCCERIDLWNWKKINLLAILFLPALLIVGINTSSKYEHVMHSSSTVSIGNHFYAICNYASLRIASWFLMQPHHVIQVA